MSSNAIARRRLPRKTLVVVAVLALVLVGGAAWALYLMSAKVTGSASTKTLSYSWAQNVTPTAVGDASTCTGSIPDTGNGNALNLNVSSYPGDTCTVSANLAVTGSESVKVTGIALTGLPTGWTAETLSCGTTVGTTSTPVKIKITVGPSGSGTLGGGLQLTPVSQVQGTPTCSVQTGA